MIQIFLLFLILLPHIGWGDSNSSNSQLLIGEQNGTNVGRYRSLMFSNGTTTNNNDGSISVNNSGGAGSGWTLTDGSNTVTGVTNLTVTGGTVGGSTPNATLLISGSGTNYWTNGSVGIGTTFNVGVGTLNPSSTLYVAGTANITGQLSLSTAGLSIGTSAVLIGTTGTGTIIVTNTSPTVSNAILTGTSRGGTGVASILSMEGTSGTPTSASAVVIKYGAVGALESFHENGSSGNIGIGSWSSNTANMNNTFNVIGNIGIGTNASSAYVNTTAPNGGIIVEGNVGLGVTSPGQKLDVSGTVRSNAFVTNGGSNSQFTKGDGSLDSTLYCQSGGANCPAGGINPWLTTAGPGNVGISTTNASVGIGTTMNGNNAGLVIMQGNVGIGTWNPTAIVSIQGGNVSIGTTTAAQMLTIGALGQLTVSSSGAVSVANTITTTGGSAITGSSNIFTTANGVSFGSSSATSGGSTTFQGNTSTTGIAKILSTTSASGTTDSVQLLVHSNVLGLTVLDNSGSPNVGIGTAIPNAMLDVEGTVNPVVFMAAIPSSGTNKNVGIGTFAPSQTLSIAGVIGFKQNSPTISSCGTTPSGSAVGNDAQGTITVGGTATGCTLAFIGTYAKSSHCNITNQSMSVTNAMTYTESNSGFVVSQAVGLSGDLLDYHCTFDN